MKKIIALLLTAAALGTTAAHAAPKAKAAPAKAHAQSQTARNKANARAFYEMAFNQHRVQEAADKYIGKT